MAKLVKSFVDKIPYEETEKTYWDDTLKGFGLRVRTQSKTWIIMYRNNEGVLKKLTLGKTSKINAKEARALAREKLARVVMGFDPANEKIEARKSIKMNELCELYLKEGCKHKKQSTIKMDISRIERHIKPLIGHLSVKSLTTSNIEKMMLDIAQGKTALRRKGNKPRGHIRVTGGRTTASRTVGMLGSILEFARRYRLIEHNPARGVKKYAEERRETFLDLDDIKQLGFAIKKAEYAGLNKTAIDAIKLLLLTGCRKMEILSLKWEYIDFKNKCFRFPDTKTGKQTRAFGQGALNLLLELKEHTKEINKVRNKSKKSRRKLKVVESKEWVFPSKKTQGHFVGVSKIFTEICSIYDAKTQRPFVEKKIAIHTLRHSFASLGADMGFIELTIAGLLGHTLGGTTNRYSHNVDSSILSAADKISLRIEKALNGEDEETTTNIYNFRRIG